MPRETSYQWQVLINCKSYQLKIGTAKIKTKKSFLVKVNDLTTVVLKQF